jgi:hypothetical protein
VIEINEDDKALLDQFEPIAEKIRAKLAEEADGNPQTALLLEEEAYHQFLHWLEAHRDQFSEEAQAQIDTLPRPPHKALMYPPMQELGLVTQDE